MKYKFLSHTADIKFQAFGKSLNEIFENSALAVSNYLSREKKIKLTQTKNIQIESNDNNSLFYKFLDELIYLLDAESFIISNAKVEINGNNLNAQLKGDDAKNYKDLDHIKAATYAEMYIKKLPDGSFKAQAVMDV